MEKEVDFNCYIDDNLSPINFNKMITRVPSIMLKDFLIPNTFEDESTHTLTCKASYYNLGSRTDTFSTTFLVDKNSVFFNFKEFATTKLDSFIDDGISKTIIIAISCLLLILCLSGFIIYKRKENSEEYEKSVIEEFIRDNY